MNIYFLLCRLSRRKCAIPPKSERDIAGRVTFDRRMQQAAARCCTSVYVDKSFTTPVSAVGHPAPVDCRPEQLSFLVEPCVSKKDPPAVCDTIQHVRRR